MDYTNNIINFYKNYNIDLCVTNIIDSYSITRYFIKIDRTNKTRIVNVEKLIDDLAVELNVKNVKMSIDVETGGIVFEIPKKNRKTLNLKDINYNMQTKEGLKVCFGKDLNNNDYIVNLCSTPHLLIAGTTGSGKSMFINNLLINLITNYKKDYLQLSLIDPKKVELNIYKNVEQVQKIANNLNDAKKILQDALIEIDKRYKLLENSNTRNIINYNKKSGNKLPYRIIVIDELADIILQDKKNKNIQEIKSEMSLENLIVRIAQIGRACGVHLIVATQRPSSDVITGLIKANIPSRVAFSVSSKIDSRIVLDSKGAEKLTGKGDLLFKMVGNEEIIRIQAPFVSDEEVESIVDKHINKEEMERQRKLKQQQMLQDRLIYIQKQKEIEEETEKQREQQEELVKQYRKEKRIPIYKALINIFFIFVNPITIILYLIIWGYFAFAVPTFKENENLGYGQFDSVYIDESGNKIPKNQVQDYFKNRNNN